MDGAHDQLLLVRVGEDGRARRGVVGGGALEGGAEGLAADVAAAAVAAGEGRGGGERGGSYAASMEKAPWASAASPVVR